MKIFRSKIFICILVLVLIACILMVTTAVFGKPSFLTNALGAVVTPIQKGASAVGAFFSDIFGYFYRYHELEAENEALREKVENYQKLEADYYEAIAENEQLRELTFLLRRHKDFVCEPCEVIAYSTNSMSQSFTLNKGSVSGIEVGDCVVTNAGLVGYVTSVGLNYSEVMLITDMRSSVAAMVARTRVTVIAEGSYDLASKHQLRLSYLKKDEDLKEGDLIQTSGFGELYPQGLLIGRVVEIGTESHGMSNYAIVEPAADLASLTSVFVVKEYNMVQ